MAVSNQSHVPNIGTLEHFQRAPPGRSDLGRLEPGASADLIWWSDDWEVRNVWVGGVPLTTTPGLTRSA